MYQEYTGLLGLSGLHTTAAAAVGNSLSFLVGRISYTFNLAGLIRITSVWQLLVQQVPVTAAAAVTPADPCD
jgi:hypothetical protein